MEVTLGLAALGVIFVVAGIVNIILVLRS